jgi:hypothetical protein
MWSNLYKDLTFFPSGPSITRLLAANSFVVGKNVKVAIQYRLRRRSAHSVLWLVKDSLLGTLLLILSTQLSTLLPAQAKNQTHQKTSQDSRGSACDTKRDDPRVVGIMGHWVPVDPEPREPRCKELTFGAPVSSESCVAGTEGAISLAVLFEEKAVSFRCEGRPDPPCRQPLWAKCVRRIVPQRPTQGGVASLAAAFTAAFAAAFTDPDRYIAPVARGLEPSLADSVVLLQGERIDLAPAFRAMSPGKYQVRLGSLVCGGTASQALVEWTGSGPVLGTFAGISPGLYRLVQLDELSEPVQRDAWVLAVAPYQFNKDSASFRLAEEATKAWPDDVDPRAQQAVLRAYLDSLSKRAQ